MNTRTMRIIHIFIALGFICTSCSALRAQIWEKANATHRSTQITPAGGKVIYSMANHLFESEDLGTVLTVNSAEANISGFAIGSIGIYYLSSPQGLDTTSDPINGNWVKLPASNVPQITALFVRASSDAPGQDEIFAGSAGGLWFRKSADVQWKKIHDAGDGAAIQQIVAVNSNIYYRTKKDAYASHDGGLNWKSITPSTNGSITAIVTTSDNDVYVSVSGFPNSLVLHSTDGGDSFNGPRGTNFSSHTIQALVANAQGDLFLGGGVRDNVNQDSITQGYVFRFLNNGTGWQDYSAGLPSTHSPGVIAMGFSSAGKVFVSTDSSGLWRTVLPSGVKQQPVQHGIVLSQNFPNPANTFTEFSVSTDHTIKAAIALFDALGKNVLDISNTDLNQGTHFYKVNTKPLPPGEYFLRLQTPEIIESRSFLISK